MRTVKEFASFFDHTLLKANAEKAALEKLCMEAKTYGFASVCVNPCHVAFCKSLLGDEIPVCTVVGFPLGQNITEVKIIETQAALQDGAKEIDYVVNISDVKAGAWDAVEKEMKKITAICHADGAICKVIFENCYLTDEEKTKLCQIAHRADIDFIKTSTGFGTGGATPLDVALMVKEAGEGIRVKAAGGIRTLSDALSYIELGASRIGASASVEILESYKNSLA
ncbi:MAG: deoxyribose-phosphate aldolase [Clostridia bacterium]|nr:deoxyribose-phosphate aldolase [Clostridia bacterium]